VRVVLGEDPSQQKTASMAAQILRINGRNARTVHRLDLARTGVSIQLKSWLEVLIGDRWQPFSIPTGEPRIPPSVSR
jgi:hypothetical protein